MNYTSNDELLERAMIHLSRITIESVNGHWIGLYREQEPGCRIAVVTKEMGSPDQAKAAARRWLRTGLLANDPGAYKWKPPDPNNPNRCLVYRMGKFGESVVLEPEGELLPIQISVDTWDDMSLPKYKNTPGVEAIVAMVREQLEDGGLVFLTRLGEKVDRLVISNGEIKRGTHVY